MPHAAEQLSSGATAVEPVLQVSKPKLLSQLHNYWSLRAPSLRSATRSHCSENLRAPSLRSATGEAIAEKPARRN